MHLYTILAIPSMLMALAPGTLAVNSMFWSPIDNDMGEARSGATSVVHNGMMFVVGGRKSCAMGIKCNLKSGEVLNMSSQTWVPLKNDMSYARQSPTSVIYAGKMYVVGGYGGDHVNHCSSCYYKSGEVLDIATQTWAPLANSMRSRRWGATSVQHNGKM